MDSSKYWQWGGPGLWTGREEENSFLFGRGLCLIATVTPPIDSPLPSPHTPFYHPFSQWNKSFSCHPNGISPHSLPPPLPSSLPPSLPLFHMSPSLSLSLLVRCLWKNTSGSTQWKALEREISELMRSKLGIVELQSPHLASDCLLNLSLIFPLVWSHG